MPGLLLNLPSILNSPAQVEKQLRPVVATEEFILKVFLVILIFLDEIDIDLAVLPQNHAADSSNRLAIPGNIIRAILVKVQPGSRLGEAFLELPDDDLLDFAVLVPAVASDELQAFVGEFRLGIALVNHLIDVNEEADILTLLVDDTLGEAYAIFITYPVEVGVVVGDFLLIPHAFLIVTGKFSWIALTGKIFVDDMVGEQLTLGEITWEKVFDVGLVVIDRDGCILFHTSI